MISNNQHRTLLQGHAGGLGCGPWSQRVGLLSLQGVLYLVVHQARNPFHKDVKPIILTSKPNLSLSVHCHPRPLTAILPSTSGEVLQLFEFDDPYLKRLRDGDPSTESHFVVYFSQLLQLKLRARFLAPDVVDDLRQETFTRVLRSIRADGGIREASRLGAYVNSVCNNVLLEYYRAGNKNVPLESEHFEMPDKV